MEESDLGYLKDYGHIIISFCLILYATLVCYLDYYYGDLDDE